MVTSWLPMPKFIALLVLSWLAQVAAVEVDMRPLVVLDIESSDSVDDESVDSGISVIVLVEESDEVEVIIMLLLLELSVLDEVYDDDVVVVIMLSDDKVDPEELTMLEYIELACPLLITCLFVTVAPRALLNRAEISIAERILN